MITEGNYRDYKAYPQLQPLKRRTWEAIRRKISYLNLSSRRTTHQGMSYTGPELGVILGVSPRRLERYVGFGILREVDWIPAFTGERSRLAVSWASVDDMLTTWPMLFDLDAMPDAAPGARDHKLVLARAGGADWFTTAQAAAIVQRDTLSVQHWAQSGELRGKQVLGKWYFHRTDLARFAARRGINLDRVVHRAA